jgi:lysyl-tRNA synthetase class 1
MQKIDRDIAMKCRTWPFEEARKVLGRLGGKAPAKGYVVFETGYGPSGLPHIGTFGEVARTSMVRFAFTCLSDIPTKLICFSDDMDGLRKVPDNVPNPDILRKYVEIKDKATDEIMRDPTPLTSVEDPFGKFESFAHHNNAKLCEFLDSFGFEYEFKSSTQCYHAGEFNRGLIEMLKKHEQVSAVVTEILGEDRRSTYCPIFPIVDWPDADTGEKRKKVLHNVKIIKIVDLEKGIAEFEVLRGQYKGKVFQHSILNGGSKAQWRPDWGLRWYMLDVDYEMAGTDLRTAADAAKKVTKILGGNPPEGFHYELFLDENGEKISKSKGNGLTMEEWLKYAPNESLAYYMYLRPTSGKKLYFDVIPKAVDEYLQFAEKLPLQHNEPDKMLDNPAFYIHEGRKPQHSPVSFALLLNLASAANAHDKETMWGFIRRYAPQASPEASPFLDKLVEYAVRYYNDFVLPTKSYRLPDERERKALADLSARLQKLPDNADSEALQTEVFSAGKENGYPKEELRTWFQAIYEVLIGQTQGPRFGTFIALYGKNETIQLINEGLDGKFVKAEAA